MAGLHIQRICDITEGWVGGLMLLAEVLRYKSPAAQKEHLGDGPTF